MDKLQAKYKEVIGKDAPARYKNDEAWLTKKIDEAGGLKMSDPVAIPIAEPGLTPPCTCGLNEGCSNCAKDLRTPEEGKPLTPMAAPNEGPTLMDPVVLVKEVAIQNTTAPTTLVEIDPPLTASQERRIAAQKQVGFSIKTNGVQYWAQHNKTGLMSPKGTKEQAILFTKRNS